MHKSTTDTQQRQARQLWLRDLSPNVDWDSLSPEERRANLVSAKKGLDNQIAALPKNSERRKELGKLAAEICTEINRIRPKSSSPSATAQHFVDICRERMTKPQFAAIMGEAARRAESDERKSKESEIPDERYRHDASNV